jgi:glycine dehydrogenase subunit 1
MRFIPNTREVRDGMLGTLGFSSIEDLFTALPKHLRLKGPLHLPAGSSEKAVLGRLAALGAQNASARTHASFLGAGSYRHFIPAALPYLLSRGEFLTAYTPYQPEVSQGTLQAMYEFQSYVCLLTGMDVSNASLYDGASATAEALLMAHRITGRRRFLVAESLHPEYRQTIATYTANLGIRIKTVPCDSESGRIDADQAERLAGRDFGGMIVQSPNFFGVVEKMGDLADAVHGKGGLLIAAFSEPFALGLLRSPGEQGADIAAGDGQSFGSPTSFGGPGVGMLATRKQHVRNMPGRIVGRTKDRDGNNGFVLTLATREQHIRREKATSNICSNQGLCALAATVYLSLLGRQGLHRAAEQNAVKARWLKERILAVPGFEESFSGPVFNEFLVRTDRSPATVRRRLLKAGILGGLDVGRWYPKLKKNLLFCVTEDNTQEEMERLVSVLEGLS